MKMVSTSGKEKYSKRMKSVEAPFGDIKRNFNFNEFTRRGLKMVNIEAQYLAVAHNIKIINNYLIKKEKENT